ncbi:MAG TPA: response regulator transcription factor [Dehalococcoidia bacterium]|jgi:two-component system KDP operon response regulator KdpE|nr:response regulator transcription factor [Dehalococcoidia bacterium]
MNTGPLVLAVDDEPGILRLIKLELTPQGFRVLTAENAAEAMEVAQEYRPDIALLDIVMPDMSGLELMRELRERGDLPVILLTAKGSDTDKVRGLEMGADDYLAKPFSPDELSARVRAVLRRAVGSTAVDNIVRIDDVEIDLNHRLVRSGGELISLTRTEWMLMQHLAANAGKVMLNAELLSKVWGPEYRNDLQYLRVWVSRLRHKLEKDPSKPRLIKTFQGIGYMLDVPEPAEVTA